MKIKVYFFTDKGREVYEKLSEYFHDVEISKKENMEEDFKNSDALIFIGATGIAVRLIAPYIKSKINDPCVIVIDDLGRFTISLLSGHLGGGNALSLKISEVLENTAVITTASDGRNMEALDIFAKKHNLLITDFKAMKHIMTDIVNERDVGYYSEIVIEPMGIKFIKSRNFKREDLSSWVIISSLKIETIKPKLWLIPKNLNVGMGCKKDTPYETLREVLNEALSEINCDIRGIKSIATIPLKAREIGILKLCEELDLKLTVFQESDINKVEIEEPSDFVKKTTGVYAVSEPCAVLSGGKMILRKYKKNGVTVSIAKEGDYE